MDDPILVPCPSCLRPNRVPSARLAERPSCGSCKAPLFGEHPVELDDDTFARYVEHAGLPVLVDFWAGWCGPCRAMAPHFETAARSAAGRALFAKLDTDAAPATAERFGIRSIPTLILFREGAERARSSGAMGARELLDWLAAKVA